ncbi:MAG: DNA-directed RNA polymerase subunit alpha [Sedimentisphaerales bacterium]|nr:DNA-directed RNA polymerase subunit alpha [Sedimentisphaerales bacterium]
MRIRWRGLELPTLVKMDNEVSTDTYGRLYIEPFERGFGTTVGNSLRRILLSSLEGSAVTSFKIKGADHEFTSLPGVVEDITDIVLNIKSLVVKLESNDSKIMRINVNKAGIVKAGDIQADPAIEIINKEHVIATLTEDIEFSMEMTVQHGRGYVPALSEETEILEQEHGVIPVDAIFSPVVRVRYKTEETRVGQRINYDRLIMEIWTNGTIGPEMALVESAKILRKHLNPFVSYFEIGEEFTDQNLEQVKEVQPDEDEELLSNRAMPISELDLSVRASNCLEMAKIETVGQLADMSESELLALRSFGKTSLREVKRKLADLGFEIGSGKD